MRNTILRLLGLSYIINIIDEFEYQADLSDSNSVRVYPAGDFSLSMHYGQKESSVDFHTAEERAAFSAGLQCASQFFKGVPDASSYSDEFLEEMSDMDKILLNKKPYGNA